MTEHKNLPRRTAKPVAQTPPPVASKKRSWIRYGFYATVVAAAIGIRFWLAGPKIPTPSFDGLDPVLVEEIENARAEIWESPQEPEKWGRVGMLYAAHSLADEAVQCFERAGELQPESWKWPYLKSMATEQSDPAASLAALREAADTAGDEEPLPRLLLAERLMEQGELAECERQLQIALTHWPQHPRAHLNYARLQTVRDDADAALKSLAHATADHHTRRSAHQLLIQIHRRRGDDAAASAAVEQLARLPQDEAWPDRWREALGAFRISKGAYIARINDLGRRGETNKLARTAAESIERYPELAHLVSGRERSSRGDLAGAEQALREAVRLDPTSVDAHLSLGEVLLAQGQTEAAVESFRSAVKVEPAHGQAHFRLGEALLRLGEKDKSVASFRAAIQFMPTSAEAHRSLAEALEQSGDAEAATEHRRIAERLAKE
jgi:tetratricopeptide (TPR) repeat protein